MTDDRAELHRLMLGRTTTAAVEAILAAGFQRPKQYKREEWERCSKGPHSQAAHILDCDPKGASWHECEEWQMRDSAASGRRYCAACGKSEKAEGITHITVTPCDPEAYARGHNDGYEAAIAQGLADDPTQADDWLQAKLQAAKVEALEESARDLDRRIAELKAES